MENSARCRHLLAAVACLCLVACSKTSALDTAREWARLAPYPVDTSEIELETLGSPFSREFRLRFSASDKELSDWLRSSPGVRDAAVSVDGPWTIYLVEPGHGAQFAEVRVNQSSGDVRVRTYWS